MICKTVSQRTVRDLILEAVRSNTPDSHDLPEVESTTTDNQDPVGLFLERLITAGGTGYLLDCLDELPVKVNALFPDSDPVFSNIPGLAFKNQTTAGIAAPQDYNSIDLAVVKGEFAVAENGAVWITDRQLSFRSVLFLAQHLVLAVEKEKLVSDMVQAYQTILAPMPGFGCFISGPSKTADIEQALVIGAHGARTLTVFLY